MIIYISVTMPSFIISEKDIEPDIIIVESFLNDQILQETLTYLNKYPNKQIYIGGYPIERGSLLIEFKNYADLTKLSLIELGIADSLMTIINLDTVLKDRTYLVAKAISKTFTSEDKPKVLLLTSETHSSRSFYLYKLAFGEENVGVKALNNIYYDRENWYKSSYGFRLTLSEFIALIYAHTLFSPEGLDD